MSLPQQYSIAQPGDDPVEMCPAFVAVAAPPAFWKHVIKAMMEYSDIAPASQKRHYEDIRFLAIAMDLVSRLEYYGDFGMSMDARKRQIRDALSATE
jgi:hypothetical protein